MKALVLLLLANAAALAAGSPMPQNPKRVYDCPKIATTGDTTTSPITIGSATFPTVTVTGFDPGAKERLVCSVGGGLTTATGLGTVVVIGD